MPETILAFDFGLRRIGVAIGQYVTGSASPVGIVANSDEGVDHQRIKEIVDEWRPTRIVVGMPTHVDGSPGDMTNAVEAFIRALEPYGLPVDTVDERYTSLEAERILKDARQMGTRGRISKDDVDAAAAVVIAERYLAGR